MGGGGVYISVSFICLECIYSFTAWVYMEMHISVSLSAWSVPSLRRIRTKPRYSPGYSSDAAQAKCAWSVPAVYNARIG